MKIYDCVMFFNELDMLETRMHILEDAVDKFVVCEAAQTHSGQPKPYYFNPKSSQFDRWKDMIIYVQIPTLDGPGVNGNSWNRERYHRRCINTGLGHLYDGDWAIVADCDEIPDPHHVIDLRAAYSNVEHVRFELDFYYYDLKHKVNQGWSIGAHRKSGFFDPNNVRTGNMGLPPYKVKTVIGGWHFSYFGGASQIIKKVDAFMHYNDPGIKELPRETEYIESRIKKNSDLYGRDLEIQYIRGDIPSSMPLYILENEDHYREIGWIPA